MQTLAAAPSSGHPRAWCMPSKGRKGELRTRGPHPHSRHPGRSLVDAAGCRAAVFGADLADHSDHSRRSKSFCRTERGGACQLRSCLRHACGPKCPTAGGWNRSRPSVEFRKSGEHASEFKVLPDGAAEGRYRVHAVVAAQRPRIQRRLQPGHAPRHRRILLLPARRPARRRRECESSRRT